MAYAAVLSLKRTLSRFLDSSLIEIDDKDQIIMRSADKKVDSLKDLALRLDNSKRMEVLAGKITEAVWKLQDTLESLLSNQFFSQSEISGDDEGQSLKLCVCLDEDAKQVIASFVEMVKKLKQVYDGGNPTSSNPLSEEVAAVSSRTDYSAISSKMFGLSDQYSEIKQLVLSRSRSYLCVVPLLGMAGIGKTTIAKKIFEDPSVLAHFECRAFVTLGQKYRLKQVILCILTQMEHKVDEIQTQSEQELADYLCKSLQGRRYLIVLDDVWNKNYWDDEFRQILTNRGSASRIMLTTRLAEVAGATFSSIAKLYPEQIRFLNKEESWELLRVKVFGENYSCPYELEKAGKKIAEVCEGLPLTIITVARLLSEARDKTPEFWNKVAEKRNTVFTDAYDEMYEVLYPSYTYLPQDLQGCFLYMGVFPLSFGILASKLYNLWEVENVLEDGCLFPVKLKALVGNSIVLVRQKSSTRFRTKTCYLHSVFLYLCVKEAEKVKFFHMVNSNTSEQCRESERRLCIQNNVLFGIEEVSESMKSMEMVRSILCMGEYHRYPVQICFAHWRLLKVVDALSIRFYEFPMEVLKLFHLTYLAITCNKDLPTSISKLWNLEYLIVHRYLTIKYYETHSYLPMNIWYMKKLKHLEVIGSDLPEPDPSCGDAVLETLKRLLGVSTRSCTQDILSRIPYLTKLGIQIEFGPDDCQPLSCFDHLSHMELLSSLKCVILNPDLMSYQVVPFPTSMKPFPSCLTKLSLSGLGYPWEHIRTIAQMPNLEVLKLRNYAFRGPTWKINNGEFKKLEYLLIEDTDLEYLTADDECSDVFTVGRLPCLILRHCYKLKEIHPSITRHVRIREIELVDCPTAMALVEKLQLIYATAWFHSSWDETSRKARIRGRVSSRR